MLAISPPRAEPDRSVLCPGARTPHRATTVKDRRRAAIALARGQGQVLSRAQLRDLGIDRRLVAREVAAGRWRLWGFQTVALHTTDLSPTAQRWRAIFEVGERITLLDGITSLQECGLKGFEEDTVWVSIKHTGEIRTTVTGLRVKKVIRRVPHEAAPQGIPRTVPEVAAVRAAAWAVSDRQAALLLVMPVQQGLTTGDRLLAASRLVGRRRRRALIHRLCRDIADGAQSLGELDFTAICRRHGLPEPSRQAVRRGPAGTIYLDVSWDALGLALEIDGSQHFKGLGPTDDAFRQNEVVIGNEKVLRMTLLGLRLEEARFVEQLRRALASSPTSLGSRC